MSKYTVALLRPQRFLSHFYGFSDQQDLGYLAQVQADSIKAAIAAARKEVCKADRRDLADRIKERDLPAVKADEYVMLWVLPGHVSAVAYGFEGQS